jgi:hypothetical protein
LRLETCGLRPLADEVDPDVLAAIRFENFSIAEPKP